LNESALVEEYLDHEKLAIVYGPSNSGKTFWMLDLAFNIALSRAWNGKCVEGGGVYYIAAEGGRRMKDRIAAFKKTHGLEAARVPFMLGRGSINLLHPQINLKKWIARIKSAEKIFGVPMRAVVIDTANCAFSGGDENSSKDMSMFLANLRQLRDAVRATIIVIHHSGNEIARGIRGHSSLNAGVDTAIEIHENRATLRKQRDFGYGMPYGFQLEKVVVGMDSKGKERSSCVVKQVDIALMESFETQELQPGSPAHNALTVLEECLNAPVKGVKGVPEDVDAVAVKTWREAYIDRYCAKSRATGYRRFNAAKEELKRTGKIDETKYRKDAFVWLVPTDAI
jgi:hypothetical protein